MELYELRALHAVVELGSFRAAATKLNRSASAVSSHIKQLEADIGTQLVERSGVVSATPAGLRLIAETRAAIAALEQAAEVARQVAQHGLRRVRIGQNGASAMDALRRVLPSLLRADPELTVELHEGPSTELLERLADGRADLAFVRPPTSGEHLSDRWLLDEELIAALPDEHPLASKPALHLADLADDAFVLPPGSLSTRARGAIVDACIDYGSFRPRRIQEATSTASILALVAAGGGVTILPKRSFTYYRTSGVRSSRILDSVAPLPLHLAWRSDDHDPTIATIRNALLPHGTRRR